MFGLIFNIILAIIIFIAMGFSYKFIKGRGYESDRIGINWVGLNKKQFLAVIPFIFIFFSMLMIIPANTVGIKYDPLNGGVQEGTLTEGIHFKMPWVTVYKLNTEVEVLEFLDISVQTQDSQWVKTDLQVQLAIDKGLASSYFSKYRNRGLDDIQSLIRSTIQRELEKETTKVNIMQLLGEERSHLVTRVNEALRNEFKLDGIRVDRVVLVDTDAGETIENSIAREAAAKKDAETAEHEKEKAQHEGEARRIAAELEALAKIAEAEGEAEALRLVAEALRENPSLIQLEWIKKWDGKLPQVTSGDSGIILDLAGLDK